MNFDDYKVKMDYPSRPTKPSILRKSVEELTDEELANVIKIKKHWASQQETYTKAVEAYRIAECNCMKQFRADLFQESRIDDRDVHDRIYSYAWEHGHSSGLEEVARIYDEIVDIFVGYI